MRVPKLRIDGTQRPTNAPSSLLPENQREMENRNDAPAATTKPAFEICSLVMFFFLVLMYFFAIIYQMGRKRIHLVSR